jgi:iron complex outermembrane receptor protein
VGQTGSARTDSEGRFTLAPDPPLPATLIVIGTRGEIYPPIYVERLAPTLTLQEAFRETVTVTTGAAPNIEAPPAAAPVVVGGEELEQRKPAHIADAVARVPGVTIRGEGAPAVPVVRGLAGGRTLLLVDDARIVAERRAGPSATFINPLTLGSIEIARGPGSVAYGSDAIGGTVHMRTRDPIPGAPGFRYDAWSAFGGETTRSISAEVTEDAFGGAVLAAIHVRAADDLRDADGEVIPNSQFRDRGALFRFIRDADWGRLRLGLMTSIARETGAPSTDPGRTYYPDERATLLTGGLDLQPSGFFDVAAVRASLGAYSITTTRERSATQIESSAVKARDASFRVSVEHHGAKARFVVGSDFVSRFNLRASGSIEDADRYDFGLFTSYDTRLSRALQLAAGARADYVSTQNEGGHFGDQSIDDVALSGYFAATAGPWNGITATAQIASGYREPTLSDRFFRGVSGRGFITGNPALEPERTRQLDAAVRWSGSRTTAALFAYQYRIRNLVERYRSGNDFFFRNRGEAEVRGLEGELTTRLPFALELNLGAAIARGEDLGSGAALDDISAPVVHAGLRWAAESASVFLLGSAYGRDEYPGPVEVERPGYVTIDVGTGWRVSDRFELRVAIHNLTNVDRFGSADAASVHAAGRSFIIGINR